MLSRNSSYRYSAFLLLILFFVITIPVGLFSAQGGPNGDIDAWFARVTELENKGKWSEADTLYQEITQKFPDRPEAWFFYGQSLLGRKRFQEAIEPLEKSRSLAPKVSRLYLLLIQCYIETGQMDKAQERLAQLKEIKPESGDVDYWQGKIHTSQSDWPKAVEYFQTALKKKTQYRTESRLGLAASYLQMGEKEKSKRYFDEGIAEAKTVLVGLEGRRTPRRWDLSVGSHGFYTSNVLGIDDKTPRLDELPSRGDFGVAWYLDGGVKAIQSEWFDLQARYSYFEDLHLEAESVNFLSNAITLQPRIHHDRWYIESDLGWQHDMLGGDPFRHAFIARPAAGYQWDNLSVRSGYGWSDSSYHRAPLNRDQDRDNTRHTWFTDAFYFPRKFGIHVITAGMDVGTEDNKGADYDHNFFQVRLGFRTVPYHKFRFGAWTSAGKRNYEDANSLAPVAYSMKRHSTSFSLGTEISRSITRGLTAFTRYNYGREYSNINVFESTSHTVSLGCRYEL